MLRSSAVHGSLETDFFKKVAESVRNTAAGTNFDCEVVKRRPSDSYLISEVGVASVLACLGTPDILFCRTCKFSPYDHFGSFRPDDDVRPLACGQIVGGGTILL